MSNAFFNSIDIRLLRCFAVVAEENNLRRAAERLFMSQPPLSRHIKNLEERLGIVLFIRHTKGLALTEDGAKVLETIRPLLKMQDSVFEQLREISKPSAKRIAVGFTTAFEQGVFAGLEKRLRSHYGERLHLVRSGSPKLVRDLRKGKLDAALVVLPLDAPGLELQATHYAEPHLAALPACWLKVKKSGLPLKAFNGKPLFWFPRESNPAFFDFAKAIFAHAGFEPQFKEEPAEHDVLLARIAAGEGMGLFAASFSAIQRRGVVFVPVDEGNLLNLKLGIAVLPGRKQAVEEFMKIASATFSPNVHFQTATT